MVCYECMKHTNKDVYYDTQYTTNGICDLCQIDQKEYQEPMTEQERYNKGWAS